MPAASWSRRSASRPGRIVAEPAGPGRQPGWREVLIVAAVVVAVVLGLAVATSLLPTQVQQVVFHTPLLILVLIGGTGWLLWRVSRRRSDPREP
jgi:heme A synthase